MALAVADAKTAAKMDADNAYLIREGKQVEVDRVCPLGGRCSSWSFFTLQNG
jgi:hypothetical protein